MDYSALNAKVKAMKQRLLKYDDYERLSMIGSVQEFGRSLGEFPAYSEALAGLGSSDVHRGQLEHKIIFSLSEDFSRIYTFISDNKLRRYMNAFYLSYEIQILNMLICMVYDERDISYSIPELNELFGNKLSIDVSKLITAKTVPELIDNLRGTDFYSLLANVYKDDGSSSLFQLEMQLDLYYYMHLWRQQKKYLDKNNLDVMERIKGTEVDLRNILWAYRLKKYYSIEPAHIYAYLIPINYRLSTARLNRMVEADSEKELMNEIMDSPYGSAFTDYTKVEQVFYREMYKAYHKAETSYPNSLAVTVGYMHRKEVELKNITALLEGIRYSMEPKRIMGYLYNVR